MSPVGYLISSYPKVSETFIAREIAALRRRGVDVRTLSIRRAPADQILTDADRRAAADTFNIQPVDPARLLRAHLRALRAHPVGYLRTLKRALTLSAGGARATLWQLFYFAEAIVLWDECRAQGIRHLHAHFANVASAVAMLAAEYAGDDGVTWSFTMHGPTEFDDVTRFALAEKIRSAAFVACISDYCRSQLMKLVQPTDWGKLHVVRCGLDFTGADQPPAPAHTNGRVHILSVGRLVPDKGQTILLNAVGELHRRGIPASLTLVGEGPERSTLEHAARRLGIADCVSLLGWCSQDQISDLNRAADIFCLPSLAEGLPVVLMEAMAGGLPVVATRIAGVAELVEDGVSGAVIPPGRGDALADALAELAVDPARRARLGESGRRRVREQHDVDHAAQQLAALFHDTTR